MIKVETEKPEAARDYASKTQEAAPDRNTGAHKLHDEVESLSGELERFYRRAFGDVPKASELGEIRVLQATLKDLVRRALSAGAADGSSDQLAEVTAERDKLKDAVTRARADFLNYQSRAAKDLERAEELSLRKYVTDLLPILDGMDLASQDAAGNPDVGRLKEALEMIDLSMKQALSVRGLERIQAKGKPFDPTVHEAVAKRPVQDGEAPNSVAEELRAGYLWKGLVLRPAQVLVTEGSK